MREVFCVRAQKKMEGLPVQVYPGALGKRIFEEVGAASWRAWLGHQTLLINEHRLNVLNPEHRTFLEQEMEKFFFGQGSETPEGFRPVGAS